MTIIRNLICWTEAEPKVSAESVEIVCARCRRSVIFPADIPVIPTYCGATCRTKAQRARRKQRRGLTPNIPTGPTCPHPTKARFETEGSAESARLYRFPRNVDMQTYQCRCGWWHIGHRKGVS